MLATLTSSMWRRRDLVMTRRRVVGFTLIELMVTVAVAVILSMVAVPSFRQFILNQRIKNTSYDLVSALTMARSEAITRNAPVSLAASGASWANGWCVITPPPTTPTDCSTAIITHEALNGSMSVNSYVPPSTPGDAGDAGASLPRPTSTGLPTITYGASGRATTATNLFVIDPATELTGVKTRCVTVSSIGVPRSIPVEAAPPANRTCP